jgi:hypothetical protein
MIPAELIDGVDSKTMAHEALGQSVIHSVFRAIAKAVGQALRTKMGTISHKVTVEVSA